MSADKAVRGPSPASGGLDAFSLVGGPLTDLAKVAAARIGHGDTVLVGAGLSVALWAILGLLAAGAGLGERFFSLHALALHARMLVAVPLILLCGRYLDRTVRDACGELVRSGIVTGTAKLALDRDAARLARIATSRWSQLGLLCAVVAFSLLLPVEYLPGVAIIDEASAPASISAAGLWYWYVCLPAFRFVMARFFLQVGLWAFLLWRLARQPLNLSASHPDRAGGLGLLGVAQAQLAAFVLALAVIDAAALAAGFQNGEVEVERIYVQAFLVLVLGLLTVVGPLVPHMTQLFQCRLKGMVAYGTLAREYSRQFDRRWTEPTAPDYHGLLGSPDIQSLADISGAYENARFTRLLPVDRTLILTVLCCAVVPYALLLLVNYPTTELIANLFQAVLGL